MVSRNRADRPVAVVTGAGRGLGRSHALALAASGMRVVVNDLGVGIGGADRDESPADTVVSEIEAAGGEAVSDHSDISTWEGGSNLVARVVEDYGRFDVLVTNAGILRDSTIADMTESDVDAVMAVHVKGTLGPLSHAARYWRSHPEAADVECRRVITTTSPSGLFSVGNANYSLAKSGIAGLTLLASRELAAYGATVNSIAPRALTRMTDGIARIRDGASPTPGGLQPYAPEHVSTLVSWLAGSRASGVTGHVFLVYGGFISVVDGWTSGAPARSASGWVMSDLDSLIPDLVGSAQPPAGLNGERPAEHEILIGTQ